MELTERPVSSTCWPSKKCEEPFCFLLMRYQPRLGDAWLPCRGIGAQLDFCVSVELGMCKEEWVVMAAVVVVAVNRTRNGLSGGLGMDSQCCKLEVGLSQLKISMPEATNQRDRSLGVILFPQGFIGQPRALVRSVTGSELAGWRSGTLPSRPCIFPRASTDVAHRGTVHRFGP